MDLRAKCNIVGIHHDRDVLPGEIFQPRDDDHGREMTDAGIAEEFDPEGEELLRLEKEAQAQMQAKADLLAAIQAAQTIEELTALMPEEEPDPDLVEAFKKRMDEMEPEGSE